MSLVWTKEPPKEPGWYWHRTIMVLRPEMVHAVRCEDGHVFWGVDFPDSEWAGPIPLPEERDHQ